MVAPGGTSSASPQTAPEAAAAGVGSPVVAPPSTAPAVATGVAAHAAPLPATDPDDDSPGALPASLRGLRHDELVSLIGKSTDILGRDAAPPLSVEPNVDLDRYREAITHVAEVLQAQGRDAAKEAAETLPAISRESHGRGTGPLGGANPDGTFSGMPFDSVYPVPDPVNEVLQVSGVPAVNTADELALLEQRLQDYDGATTAVLPGTDLVTEGSRPPIVGDESVPAAGGETNEGLPDVAAMRSTLEKQHQRLYEALMLHAVELLSPEEHPTVTPEQSAYADPAVGAVAYTLLRHGPARARRVAVSHQNPQFMPLGAAPGHRESINDGAPSPTGTSEPGAQDRQQADPDHEVRSRVAATTTTEVTDDTPRSLPASLQSLRDDELTSLISEARDVLGHDAVPPLSIEPTAELDRYREALAHVAEVHHTRGREAAQEAARAMPELPRNGAEGGPRMLGGVPLHTARVRVSLAYLHRLLAEREPPHYHAASRYAQQIASLLAGHLTGVPVPPGEVDHFMDIESVAVIRGYSGLVFLQAATALDPNSPPLPAQPEGRLADIIDQIADDGHDQARRYTAAGARAFLRENDELVRRLLARALGALLGGHVDPDALRQRPSEPGQAPSGSADRNNSPASVALALQWPGAQQDAWTLDAEYGASSAQANSLHRRAQTHSGRADIDAQIESWRFGRTFPAHVPGEPRQLTNAVWVYTSGDPVDPTDHVVLFQSAELTPVPGTVTVSGALDENGYAITDGTDTGGTADMLIAERFDELAGADTHRSPVLVVRLLGHPDPVEAYARRLQRATNRERMLGRPAPRGVVFGIPDRSGTTTVWHAVSAHTYQIRRFGGLDQAVEGVRGQLPVSLDLARELRARASGRVLTTALSDLDVAQLASSVAVELPVYSVRASTEPAVGLENELRIPIRPGASPSEALETARRWLDPQAVREMVPPDSSQPSVTVRVGHGLRAAVHRIPADGVGAEIHVSVVRPEPDIEGIETRAWVNHHRAVDGRTTSVSMTAVPLTPTVDWSFLDRLPADVRQRLTIAPGRISGDRLVELDGQGVVTGDFAASLVPPSGESRPIVILTKTRQETDEPLFVQRLSWYADVVVSTKVGGDREWHVFRDGMIARRYGTRDLHLALEDLALKTSRARPSETVIELMQTSAAESPELTQEDTEHLGFDVPGSDQPESTTSDGAAGTDPQRQDRPVGRSRPPRPRGPRDPRVAGNTRIAAVAEPSPSFNRTNPGLGDFVAGRATLAHGQIVTVHVTVVDPSLTSALTVRERLTELNSEGSGSRGFLVLTESASAHEPYSTMAQEFGLRLVSPARDSNGSARAERLNDTLLSSRSGWIVQTERHAPHRVPSPDGHTDLDRADYVTLYESYTLARRPPATSGRTQPEQLPGREADGSRVRLAPENLSAAYDLSRAGAGTSAPEAGDTADIDYLLPFVRAELRAAGSTEDTDPAAVGMALEELTRENGGILPGRNTPERASLVARRIDPRLTPAHLRGGAPRRNPRSQDVVRPYSQYFIDHPHRINGDLVRWWATSVGRIKSNPRLSQRIVDDFEDAHGLPIGSLRLNGDSVEYIPGGTFRNVPLGAPSIEPPVMDNMNRVRTRRVTAVDETPRDWFRVNFDPGRHFTVTESSLRTPGHRSIDLPPLRPEHMAALDALVSAGNRSEFLNPGAQSADLEYLAHSQELNGYVRHVQGRGFTLVDPDNPGYWQSYQLPATRTALVNEATNQVQLWGHRSPVQVSDRELQILLELARAGDKGLRGSWIRAEQAAHINAVLGADYIVRDDTSARWSLGGGASSQPSALTRATPEQRSSIQNWLTKNPGPGDNSLLNNLNLQRFEEANGIPAGTWTMSWTSGNNDLRYRPGGDPGLRDRFSVRTSAFHVQSNQYPASITHDDVMWWALSVKRLTGEVFDSNRLTTSVLRDFETVHGLPLNSLSIVGHDVYSTAGEPHPPLTTGPALPDPPRDQDGSITRDEKIRVARAAHDWATARRKLSRQHPEQTQYPSIPANMDIVQTTRDGYCLLESFILSAPDSFVDALPMLPPQTLQWLNEIPQQLSNRESWTSNQNYHDATHRENHLGTIATAIAHWINEPASEELVAGAVANTALVGYSPDSIEYDMGVTYTNRQLGIQQAWNPAHAEAFANVREQIAMAAADWQQSWNSDYGDSFRYVLTALVNRTTIVHHPNHDTPETEPRNNSNAAPIHLTYSGDHYNTALPTPIRPVKRVQRTGAPPRPRTTQPNDPTVAFVAQKRREIMAWARENLPEERGDNLTRRMLEAYERAHGLPPGTWRLDRTAGGRRSLAYNYGGLAGFRPRPVVDSLPYVPEFHSRPGEITGEKVIWWAYMAGRLSSAKFSAARLTEKLLREFEDVHSLPRGSLQRVGLRGVSYTSDGRERRAAPEHRRALEAPGTWGDGQLTAAERRRAETTAETLQAAEPPAASGPSRSLGSGGSQQTSSASVDVRWADAVQQAQTLYTGLRPPLSIDLRGDSGEGVNGLFRTGIQDIAEAVMAGDRATATARSASLAEQMATATQTSPSVTGSLRGGARAGSSTGSPAHRSSPAGNLTGDLNVRHLSDARAGAASEDDSLLPSLNLTVADARVWLRRRIPQAHQGRLTANVITAAADRLQVGPPRTYRNAQDYADALAHEILMPGQRDGLRGGAPVDRRDQGQPHGSHMPVPMARRGRTRSGAAASPAPMPLMGPDASTSAAGRSHQPSEGSHLEPVTQVDAPAATPARPWYLDRAALGQAHTLTVAEDLGSDAERLAREITATLPGDRPVVADFVRDTVTSLLTAPARQPGRDDDRYRAFLQRWDDALFEGVLGVAGGRLIWVRPRIGDITIAESPSGPRRFKVNFASRGSGGTSSREGGADNEFSIDGSIGGFVPVSRLIPHLPKIAITSGIENATSAARQFIAGRQMFVMRYQPFHAGLSFEVHVDGEYWGDTGEQPPSSGLLTVHFPAAYTEAAPQLDAPVPPAASPEGLRPSRAHEVLNAIAMTPVILGWQRALMTAIGDPAAVLPLAREGVHRLLNERAALNRSRLLLTGGDREGGLVDGAEVELRVATTSLRYLGITRDVTVRDDLGVGASHGSATSGSSGATVEVELLAQGLTLQNKPAGDDRRFKGYAGGGGGGGFSRSSGHETTGKSLNHTVLRREADQARYEALFEVVLTTSTRGVAVPAVRIDGVAGEVAVPAPERAEFERSVLGVDASPGISYAVQPAAVTPARPRPHRGVSDAVGPVLRDLERRPHPGEPLALASRRGTGGGVLIGLPGSEAVTPAVLQIVHEATGSEIPLEGAARDEIEVRTTRAGLEADFGRTQAGDPFTVRIDGRDVDILVRARLGDHLGSSRYPMHVNQRALHSATVAGSLEAGTSITGAVTGGLTFALPRAVRMRLGLSTGLTRADSVAEEQSSTITHYRRTETTGEVTEHVYDVTYEITVRPAGQTGATYQLEAPGRTVAQIAVPDEHAGPGEVTELGARVSGPAASAEAPPSWTSARVPFDTIGASATYPFFLTMPEVVTEAVRVHAGLNELDDQWLADPLNWPRPLWRLGVPTELGANFATVTSTDGWTIALPEHGGRSQAVIVRLRLGDVRHLGAHDTVEIEHYVQHSPSGRREQRASWAAEAGFSGGLGFRSGGVIRTDGEDHERFRQEIGATVGDERTWGSTTARQDGSIDITRATYEGTVHSYRANATVEITALRWRGDGADTETRRSYVTVPSAVDFVVPDRQAYALGLPEATSTPDTAGLSRLPIAPALLPVVGHPERVEGGDLVPALLRELAGRGVVPPADVNGARPPDSLVRLLSERLADQALESQYLALTGSGIHLWHPIVSPYAHTRYLTVSVWASPQIPTGDRGRDNVSLTLRAEAHHADTTATDQGYDGHATGYLRGRATLTGSSELGFQAGHGRQSGGSHGQSETTEVKDIYRLGVKRSHEFSIPLRFSAEVGVSHEKPEALRAVGAAVRQALFGLSLGSSWTRRVWYHARPVSWDWRASIETKAGRARIVMPAYLTRPADAPGRWRMSAATGERRGPAVRWDATPATTGPLSQALLDDRTLHPWTMLPVAEAVQRWAAVAAEPPRRRPADAKLADEEAHLVPGSGPLSPFTRSIRTGASDAMLRSNIGALLRHVYTIPGTLVRAGVDVRAVHHYEASDDGDSNGRPLRFDHKGRSYQQTARTPGQTLDSRRAANTELKLSTRLPIGSLAKVGFSPAIGPYSARATSEEATSSEVAESNAEVKQPYHLYKYDVTVVLHGPRGPALHIDVDDAWYAASAEPPRGQDTPGVTFTDPVETAAGIELGTRTSSIAVPYDDSGRPIVPRAGTATWAGFDLRVARTFDAFHPTAGPTFAPDHPILDPGAETDEVLAYLDDAAVVWDPARTELDAFARDQEPGIELTYRSDGTWIWTNTVSYYLRRYALSPDPELLAHIRAVLASRSSGRTSSR